MSVDQTYETTETSECSEVEHSSEKSFHESKILVHDLEAAKSETENEEQFEDLKTKVEILVELGSERLRPFSLSDCFTNDKPGMQLEILPKIIFDSVDDEADLDEIDLPKPVYRLTVDCGTQASVDYKSSKAQTTRSKQVNSWSQYEPRLCTEEEISQNLENPSFASFKDAAEESILDSIAHNSIADSFFYDLSSLYMEDILLEEEELTLSISGSFSCSESDTEARMISNVAWHPLHKDIFVASTVCCIPFEERTNNLLAMKSDCTHYYMWSAKNQFFPKLKLEYFDDILVLKFNTSLPNLIAGGSLTGQLVLWDLQKEISHIERISEDPSTTMKQFISAPIVRCCAVSNMDNCQKHGITYLQWIPQPFEVTLRGNVKKNPLNASYQLVTCGLDGLLQFWDLKFGIFMKPGYPGPQKFHHLDGVWDPFHVVEIFAPESRKRKALTCFTLRTSYQFQNKESISDVTESKPNDIDSSETSEIDIMSTEFYGGCDDGMILCGNFKLIRDDTGKFIVKHPDYYKSPHNSSISVLACSPFLPNVFLSAGGKCFAVWEHSIKEEPILLRQRSSYITSGKWSSTRPAVFILGFTDGSVEVWDLLRNLYEPYVFYYMSTSDILTSSIQCISELEHLIMAGDAKGVVCSMSIPSELWSPVDKELENMKLVIETKASRVIEVLKALANSDQSKIPVKSAPTEVTKSTEPSGEESIQEKKEDISEKYEEFTKLQTQILKRLGLYREDLTTDQEEDLNITESSELIQSVSDAS